MAEALANQLGRGKIQAVSAGSNPAGYVHPKSLETLERHGIAYQNPSSQSWNDYADWHFDYVITVCDAAASEPCTVFFGAGKKLHWSTPDPAKAIGSDEDINAAFDAAFHLLKKRIETELL